MSDLPEMHSVHRPYNRYIDNEKNSYFMQRTAANTAEFLDVKAFFDFRAKVRTWSRLPFVQKDCRYAICSDGSDPQFALKKMAINRAVYMVTARGFKMPDDTVFYCTQHQDVRNQAFHFDGAGNKICWVTLGPSATKGGSGIGVSASESPGYPSELKITLHEIGHTLHAHNVGRLRFFSDFRFRQENARLGARISNYAGMKNAREFVAEAFCGMMIGREYDDEVMMYYAIKGGPRVMGRFGMAEGRGESAPAHGA